MCNFPLTTADHAVLATMAAGLESGELMYEAMLRQHAEWVCCYLHNAQCFIFMHAAVGSLQVGYYSESQCIHATTCYFEFAASAMPVC